MKVGDFVHLKREIIEPATGDHPAFVLGRKNEKVQIISIAAGAVYPYLVSNKLNETFGALTLDLSIEAI